jgi:hypothetical protein
LPSQSTPSSNAATSIDSESPSGDTEDENDEDSNNDNNPGIAPIIRRSQQQEAGVVWYLFLPLKQLPMYLHHLQVCAVLPCCVKTKC